MIWSVGFLAKTSLQKNKNDSNVGPLYFASNRGLTLFEVLAAFVVIAIIMGVSLAFFSQSKKSYQLYAHSAQLSAAVRTAQSFAISNQSIGIVESQPSRNEFKIWGWQTVGQWHLENLTAIGAFNQEAKISGGTLIQGKIGQGIALRRGRILLPTPRNVFPSGFSVEFYFLTEFFQNMDLIIHPQGKIGLRLKPDATLEGYCFDHTVQAKLRPKTWHHFQFFYDGDALVLKVDQILQSQKKISISLPQISFVLGSLDLPVTGLIDEIIIRSLTEIQQIEIPQELKLLGKPQRIYFDFRGRLSRQHHSAPAVILLNQPQKQETIQLNIGLFGDIRQEILPSIKTE